MNINYENNKNAPEYMQLQAINLLLNSFAMRLKKAITNEFGRSDMV